MKLIEFDGTDFKVADEALLVRPIRELLERDRTSGKENFWRQISYLWFMCDPRSSYMYITDEVERAKEVKMQEGFDDDWKPSDLLEEAMARYRKQCITTQSLLLEGMRKGIDNVRKFISAVNLHDVDTKTGKPIYQVSTITSALKQIPELVKALADAEKALAKDFAEEDKVRGNKDKSLYEDI